MDNYKCTLCGATNWKNVDEFRYKPSGMHVCMSCAFITYEKCKDVDKVNKSYEHDYRQAPTVNNVFSSERKLHYHAVFLEDVLKKWVTESKKVNVVEIGAAIGAFLNMVRHNVKTATVYGTELTESFVRNAWHNYNLNLTPDFDDTIKYDLISSYKVAEHIPNIDKQLERYRNSLAEGGYLYISVPTWFGRLNNFGSTGYTIEDYYDPNHVNVWSQKQFEYLLAKSGFKVVKENHSYYDSTYLCQISDKVDSGYKEDPALRLEQLKKIFDASMAYDQSKFKDAIKLWPNFPVAQISYYEMNRNRAHLEGWDVIWNDYLKPALDACGPTHFILAHIVDVMMRYEKYGDALEYCKLWLDNHYMDTQALMNMAHIFRVQALASTTSKEKEGLLRQANQVLSLVEKNSLERRYEAMTWIMQNNALIPTPFEVQK